MGAIQRFSTARAPFASFLRLVPAAVAAVALAGCGGGGSSSSGSSNESSDTATTTRVATTLSLSPTELSFTALGESEELTATVRDQDGNLMPAATVEWTQIHEVRETPSLAVAARSGSSITATGAGTTSFEARVAGTTVTAEVTVTVEPTRPYVVGETDSENSGTDAVTVEAYLLDPAHVTATVDGVEATITPLDSSTAEISLPPMDSDYCGRRPQGVLSSDDADVLSEVTVGRVRSGEVHLEVGEVRALTAEQVACFMGDTIEAVYHLAWADTTDIESSESKSSRDLGTIRVMSRLLDAGPFEATALKDEDSHSPASDPRLVEIESPAAAEATTMEGDGTEWFAQEEPFAIGDVFPFYSSSRVNRGEPALVDVTIEHLVGSFAVAVTTEATELDPQLLARVIDAADRLWREDRPLLEEAFGFPHCGAANGQLVIYFEDRGTEERNGGQFNGATCHIELHVGGSARTEPFQRFYANWPHELMHAFQGAVEPAISGHRQFYTEGIAEFFELDAVRRLQGHERRSNEPWWPARYLEDGSSVDLWLSFPWGTRGLLELGYADSASYFFYVARRMEEIGYSWRDARAAVIHASLRGTHAPFVDGVRDYLGADWDPARSRLMYVLSLAVDDLTSNPDLQDPDFLYSGGNSVEAAHVNPLSLGVQGWLVSGGAESSGSDDGCQTDRQACLPSDRWDFTYPSGSVGTIRIDDNDLGAFVLETDPAAIWMATRIK